MVATLPSPDHNRVPGWEDAQEVWKERPREQCESLRVGRKGRCRSEEIECVGAGGEAL